MPAGAIHTVVATRAGIVQKRARHGVAPTGDVAHFSPARSGHRKAHVAEPDPAISLSHRTWRAAVHRSARYPPLALHIAPSSKQRAGTFPVRRHLGARSYSAPPHLRCSAGFRRGRIEYVEGPAGVLPGPVALEWCPLLQLRLPVACTESQANEYIR